MSIQGRCKDCQHWITKRVVPGLGICYVTQAYRGVDKFDPETQAWGSSDAELVRDDRAYLVTAPNFGCVQFTAQEDQ